MRSARRRNTIKGPQHSGIWHTSEKGHWGRLGIICDCAREKGLCTEIKPHIQKCMLHKQSIKWVQRGCVFLPGDISLPHASCVYLRPPNLFLSLPGAVKHPRGLLFPVKLVAGSNVTACRCLCKGIVCAYLAHWPSAILWCPGLTGPGLTETQGHLKATHWLASNAFISLHRVQISFLKNYLKVSIVTTVSTA